MIAKRIEVIEGERPAQADEQPHDVDMNNSFEDDLRPIFDDMGDLPDVAAPENVHGTAVEQVSRTLDKAQTYFYKVDVKYNNQKCFPSPTN